MMLLRIRTIYDNPLFPLFASLSLLVVLAAELHRTRLHRKAS
jgi:hypothetical protein